MRLKFYYSANENFEKGKSKLKNYRLLFIIISIISAILYIVLYVFNDNLLGQIIICISAVKFLLQLLGV